MSSRASVELVSVGTELLLGQLLDTNVHFVAARLADAGIDVYGAHTVGDNVGRIAGVLSLALERAEGVITTGGLGPTIDDLTKEAVCEVLGVDTELNEAALDQMESFFATIKREMRPNNRKQAELPRGSTVLPNPHGTAPGFIAFRNDGKFIACMPGVPREMKPMLAEQLIPLLRERLHLTDTIVTRIIHTINMGESEVDHRIADLFRSAENPKIAVLAHDARCDVKVMAKARSVEAATAMIAPLEKELVARLEGHVFGYDGETIESVVHGLLQQDGRWLAVAESCTGGRICAALTSVAGSSKSFRGGIVAYDNAVKIRELNVRESTLGAHGAVSEETALEMARGVRERLEADVGVATTGIAGPGGGTEDKPVGLVWFAIDDVRTGAKAWSIRFPRDRAAIQMRATTFALGLLWRHLALVSGPRNLP